MASISKRKTDTEVERKSETVEEVEGEVWWNVEKGKLQRFWAWQERGTNPDLAFSANPNAWLPPPIPLVNAWRSPDPYVHASNFICHFVHFHPILSSGGEN